MGTPIILGFGDGESLSSINSITLGGGVAWGKVTIPFVPLIFSQEKIAEVLGAQNSYALGRARLTNERFYNETYSGLPLLYQRRFWGTTTKVEKPVGGWAIGLSGGAIMNSASTAILSLLRPMVGRLLSSVSLDAAQVSVSQNATLYGMNGYNTYDLNQAVFSSCNVFFINAGIGCLVQSSLNIVFIGNFPRMDMSDHLNPFTLIAHLSNVYSNSIAWAIVGDSAAGMIFPGASISFISS
ncbi:hypothetical protein [Runella zeae]|jgi:hypothetical protein|uniref:hypothetical protein n=1 Tax=Runella zeae TaxID=94255 RepID=UPI0003F8B986|nr:hypothetical protein [Runella zeae]